MIDNNDAIIMYKTLLKILSHDTRNTFVKLKVLLGDLEDGPVKQMISESIEEIFETIASASGFLDGKKRIQSIYELITNLKITKDKIPFESNKRIHFICDPKVFLYVEVSELFNHALLNIIENALKYSEDEDIVEVVVKRKGPDIIVSVSDSGIGVPKEELDRIFLQGYRSRIVKDHQGTGTGLWITKNIINKDNGSIRVTSEVGYGSTFTITIPAFYTPSLEDSLSIILENFIDDPEELEKSLESVKTLIDMHNPPEDVDYDSLVFANLLSYVRKERKSRTHNHFKDKLKGILAKNPEGEKVLIVDDSTYVHYYLGNFFTDLGFRVVDFAYNGQEGVDLYKYHKPSIITMDITMPVKSGIEASMEIIEVNPGAKILFLSGLGSHKGLKESISQKLGESKVHILTKPFTKDKLSSVLKDLTS